MIFWQVHNKVHVIQGRNFFSIFNQISLSFSLLARIDYIGSIDPSTGKVELRFYIDEIDKTVTSRKKILSSSSWSTTNIEFLSFSSDFLLCSPRNAIFRSTIFLLVIGIPWTYSLSVWFEMSSIRMWRSYYRCDRTSKIFIIEKSSSW